MYGLILLYKGLSKCVLPAFMEETEASGDESIVSQEGTFLTAAFDDHVDEFHFFSWGDIDFGEFVGAFFEGCGGHDGEVDGSSEVYEIFFGEVVNDGELFVVGCVCGGCLICVLFWG